MPNFVGCRCCKCKNDTHIGLMYRDPSSPNHHFIAQWQIETGGEEWSVDVESEGSTHYGAMASLGKGKWTSIGSAGRVIVDSSGVLDNITETFSGLSMIQSRYTRLSLPKSHGSTPIYYDPTITNFADDSRVYGADSVNPDKLSGVYGCRIRPDKSFVIGGQMRTSLGGSDYAYETGVWVYDATGTLLWQATWDSSVVSGVLDNLATTYGFCVDETGAVYHHSRDEAGDFKTRKYDKDGTLVWTTTIPNTFDGHTLVETITPLEVYSTHVMCLCNHNGRAAFVTLDTGDGSLNVIHWASSVNGADYPGDTIKVASYDVQISRFSGWAVALVNDFSSGEWWFAGWPCLNDTLVSWINKTADGDPVPNSGAFSIGPC